MEVYEIVKTIGSGSFGQVYLARHKREDKMYVMKKVKTREMAQKDRENTEGEVRLLQKLRHSNIVAYKDSFLDKEGYLNIVMVYCEGGDLYNKIKNNKGKNFSEDQILEWFAQMALAIYYLHDKKILHRDLKTQNIFLKNGRLRLGDFGIAKVLDTTRDFTNTCIGTPYYMSPELFKYKPYSYKSDIWSLGCVLYEMCNLKHAFDAQSLNALAIKILKGSYQPISNHYSKNLRDLATKMLSTNPKQRPTITEVLKKPIVKRKVVTYMAEVLTGNSGDGNTDVDDMYLDSLRDQAEKLGIWQYVQDAMNDPAAVERITNDKSGGFNLDSRKASITKMSSKDGIESVKDTEPSPNMPARSNSKANLDVKELTSKIASLKDQHHKTKAQLQKEIAEKEKIEKKLEVLESKVKANRNNVRATKKALKNRERSEEPLESASKNNSSSKAFRDKSTPKIKSDYLDTPGTKVVKDDNSILKKTSSNFEVDDTATGSMKTSMETSKFGEYSKKPSLKEKEKEKEKEKDREKDREKEPGNMQRITSYDHKMLDVGGQGGHQSSNTKIIVNTAGNFHQDQQTNDRKSPEGIPLPPRERVLYEKQKRKEEEESRIRAQLKKIRKENEGNRKKAADRRAAQYKPSRGMVLGAEDYEEENSSFNDSKNVKIHEDYGMDDEEEEDYDENAENNDTIYEVDNEDEEHHTADGIEEKILGLREKLNEKTQRITSLEASMIHAKKILKATMTQALGSPESAKLPVYEDFSEEEIDFDEFNHDEEEKELEAEEDPRMNENSQYYKINEKIRNLRHRCEAGLGNNIYQSAYSLLVEKGNKLKGEEIKKNLTEILGEDNIGYWHLIDQVIFHEGLLKEYDRRG